MYNKAIEQLETTLCYYTTTINRRAMMTRNRATSLEEGLGSIWGKMRSKSKVRRKVAPERILAEMEAGHRTCLFAIMRQSFSGQGASAKGLKYMYVKVAFRRKGIYSNALQAKNQYNRRQSQHPYTRLQ